MVYYEIKVKKKDDSIHANYEYKETVKSDRARELALRKWKDEGYKVKAIKTRHAYHHKKKVTK